MSIKTRGQVTGEQKHWSAWMDEISGEEWQEEHENRLMGWHETQQNIGHGWYVAQGVPDERGTCYEIRGDRGHLTIIALYPTKEEAIKQCRESWIAVAGESWEDFWK